MWGNTKDHASILLPPQVYPQNLSYFESCMNQSLPTRITNPVPLSALTLSVLLYRRAHSFLHLIIDFISYQYGL